MSTSRQVIDTSEFCCCALVATEESSVADEARAARNKFAAPAQA